MNVKKPVNTSIENIPVLFFYIAAFIEGGCVMSIELAGAKMVAPFYGSSLYVWAAVLTVTLGGLTTGYFLGGRAAYRYQGPKLLVYVLLVGAALIFFMPFLSQQIMSATSGLEFRMGALLSTAGFMMLPLVCMGMVSPIIIQLVSTELKGTGKVAGTVYAISTVGGIIMTMLMGFYLLPEWGIRKSVLLTGSLLLLMPLAFFAFRKKFVLLSGGLVVLISFLLIAANPREVDSKTSVKIQYQTEGILGQLTVFDFNDLSKRRMRMLLMNGIAQTNVTIAYIPFSAWQYVHRLSILSSIKPPHSNALLLGMAGGTLAMEMKGMGFNVDIVDIDKRMPVVAEKYFGFKPEGVNVIIDDGRHYINRTSKTYDLVIIDVINGEVQPYHIFTKEAFAELKKKIAPDALVIINYQGYLTGEHGLSARSMYKTLLESGFKVQYYTKSSERMSDDIFFLASQVDQDFHNINPERLNPCCRAMHLSYDDLITQGQVDVSDAQVFTDDKPNLEILNNYFIEQWRKLRIDEYSNQLVKHHIPLFQ